jgi:hypothetical protein
VNGGYNYCPTNSIMGGWWKADNSSFCGGPRYYMDCNATCACTTGCGDGFNFCDTECDGTNCGCGPDGCNSYMTGCLQFRYGQCNQDVACMGRIVCRVVACIPPWEIDPTCITAVAVDEGTAGYALLTSFGKLFAFGQLANDGDESAAVLNRPLVGIALAQGGGYWFVAADGGIFTFGDAPFDGSPA